MPNWASFYDAAARSVFRIRCYPTESAQFIVIKLVLVKRALGKTGNLFAGAKQSCAETRHHLRNLLPLHRTVIENKQSLIV